MRESEHYTCTRVLGLWRILSFTCAFRSSCCFLKIKRKHLLEMVIANVSPPSFQLLLGWPLLEGIPSVRTVCCSSSRCCSPGAFCLNPKVWTSFHFLSLTYARQNAPRNLAGRLKNLPLPHSGREQDLWVHSAEWIQINSVQKNLLWATMGQVLVWTKMQMKHISSCWDLRTQGATYEAHICVDFGVPYRCNQRG